MPLLWCGSRSRWQEMEVARLVEADLALAAEPDPAALPDPRDGQVGSVRVDPVGPLAGKAEQDGAVGGVALAGQGERAVEVDLDSGGPAEHGRSRAASRQSGRRPSSVPSCASWMDRPRS